MKFSDAMLMTARIVGGAVEGTATALGTNVINDTLLIQPADFWPGGCAFLWQLGSLTWKTGDVTSGGSGAIQAGVGSVGFGQRYAATGRDWSRTDLQRAVNLALLEMGPYLTYTDLTTVAGQEAYTLAMAERAVVRVELAQETGAPYEWMLLTRYQLAGGELRFDEDAQPAVDGYKLRVWWEKQPAELANDADLLPGEYDDEQVGWTAAVYALRRRMQLTGGDRPDLIRLLNEALSKAQALKTERGFGRRMERTAQYARW